MMKVFLISVVYVLINLTFMFGERERENFNEILTETKKNIPFGSGLTL